MTVLMWQYILDIVNNPPSVIDNDIRWFNEDGVVDVSDMPLRLIIPDMSEISRSRLCHQCGFNGCVYHIGDVAYGYTVVCYRCAQLIRRITHHHTLHHFNVNFYPTISERLQHATVYTAIAKDPICDRISVNEVSYVRMLISLREFTCFDIARFIIALMCEVVIRQSATVATQMVRS